MHICAYCEKKKKKKKSRNKTEIVEFTLKRKGGLGRKLTLNHPPEYDFFELIRCRKTC